MGKDMHLGSCTYRIAVGQMVVPCPCDRGLFEGQHHVDDGPECKKCAHHSLHHGGKLAQRTPREATVEGLWKQLEKTGVVHVRGTPGSGKSTLAHLLENHVQITRPDMPVHLCSWPAEFPSYSPTELPYHSCLNHMLGRGRQTASGNWNDWRGLLIVDDAQRSYEYTSFWNDLVKHRSPESGPIVALFSSYESPSRKPPQLQIPRSDVQLSPSEEVHLNPTSAIPDVGLSYTRAEFDDVLNREFGPYSEYHHGFILDEDLIDYIWQLTSGHPAAVRTVLDGLINFLRFRDHDKHSPTITTDDVLDFLANDPALLSCVKNNIHRSKF